MSVLATRPTMGFLQSLFVAVVLTGCFVLWRYRSGLRGAPMLPGPRALPFIGCVHLLPAESAERKFREWGQTYGEHVRFLSRSSARHKNKETTVGEEELGAPAGNRLEVRATSIVSSDNAQRADLLPEREAGS